MTKTNTAPPSAEVAEEQQVDPCDVCPTRSTAQNASFAYCEGCPELRPCRSCEQPKPQTGWGWGLRWGQITWLCADCRWPPPPDVQITHPRFVFGLDLDDAQKFQVAAKLEDAADLNRVHPASDVLRRMAKSITASGSIDIDVSDFDLAARTDALKVTRRLQEQVRPNDASIALKISRAWSWFVDEQTPKPPPPPPQPTIAEQAKRLGLRIKP